MDDQSRAAIEADADQVAQQMLDYQRDAERYRFLRYLNAYMPWMTYHDGDMTRPCRDPQEVDLAVDQLRERHRR